MSDSDVKSLGRKLVYTMIGIFAPVAIAIVGFAITDHFKIKELEAYKVNKEYFDKTWFDYQLLIEDKTHALETLSFSNDLSIAEIKAEIKTIQGVQQQTLIEIAKINRERGATVSLGIK